MKKIRIVSLILALTIFLCSCSSDSPKGYRTVKLYFVNSEHNELVTENVNISDKDFASAKTLVYAVMEKLIEGPSDPEHSRVIPEGVTLKSFSQSQTEYGTINIDLEGPFYSKMSNHNLATDELLARYSIICTLCQFENIRKVKFYINGEELKTMSGKGEVVQAMGSDKILTDSPTAKEAQTEKFVTLYFKDESGRKLASETRRAVMSDNSLEKTIVNELIKGPVSDGLDKTLPKNTKLISIETAEEVCFVNISASSFSVFESGSVDERLAVYSIVNSLTRIAGIEKVQVLIDGKKPEKDISQLFSSPLEHNNSIVKEIAPVTEQ